MESAAGSILHGMQEVSGSIPLRSTKSLRNKALLARAYW